MTTTAQLIDEILLSMDGYRMSQPSMTALSADLASGVTTLTVTDISRVVPNGFIQVGSELMFVLSVDSATSTVTVVRGWRGSTMVAHVTGDPVESSPAFPRMSVLNAVNRAILAAYPRLFGVATTELTATVATTTYAMPVGCQQVLALRWLDTFNNWTMLNRWRYDADLASLLLFEGVPDGHTIKATYRTALTAVAETDDFTASGLAESATAYVRYAAAADLVSTLDIGQTSIGTEAQASWGAGSAMAQSLTGLAMLELGREQRRLQALHKPPIHLTNRIGRL